jgi:hypothetical protein
MAAAVTRNALYVFGSATSDGTRTTHMFRPVSGQQPSGWAALAKMPTGRGEAAAAAVGTDLYVMGGQVNGQALSPAPLEVMSAPPPSDFFVTSGGVSSSPPPAQWSSTNPAVAGVNTFGFAQGLGEGEATIVATANGISCEATGTCATVTVVDPECASVVLSISGNVPFTAIPVTVNGDPQTFDAPFGVNTLAIRPGTYTLEFLPPAGYKVTPNPVTFTVACGETAQVSVVVAPIDTTPPALTLPPNITADATTASGAMVTYAASALDDVDGQRPVVCSPASGSLFPIGVATVNCSASDTSGNTATGSFTVTVLDAAQVVAAMIEQLDDFHQGENLLENLLASLDRDNLSAACGQLGAFINAVRAQAGRTLTVEEAEGLEARAVGVRSVLGCQ